MLKLFVVLSETLNSL